jgi:hypothetical protein
VTLFEEVGFPRSAIGEDELDWSNLGEELVLPFGHPALRFSLSRLAALRIPQWV